MNKLLYILRKAVYKQTLINNSNHIIFKSVTDAMLDSMYMGRMYDFDILAMKQPSYNVVLNIKEGNSIN